MSKYYTKDIPEELATKMRNAGMPIISTLVPDYLGAGVGPHEMIYPPTYAEALDWLMQNGLCVSMYAVYTENQGVIYISALMDLNPDCRYDGSFGYKNTWEEAITPAIEKAIELLKEK